FIQAFGEFPVHKKPYKAERRMRLGQCRRDRNGLLRIASRFWVRGRALASDIPQDSPSFGAFGVSQGISRVELDRLIVVTNSLAKVFDITTHEIKMPLKLSVMGFYVGGSRFLS